jgi:integrase
MGTLQITSERLEGGLRAQRARVAIRPAAGLPERLRFHDLRHTCAALLIANGRHLEEVKDYLGHSSIRVTSDRYGHLFPKARTEMADALDTTYRNAAPGILPGSLPTAGKIASL